MKAATSPDLAEKFEAEDTVRTALGVLPGESVLDAARRALAAKPGPLRSMKRTRVAMVIVNGQGHPDPWATMRQAARAVQS